MIELSVNVALYKLDTNYNNHAETKEDIILNQVTEKDSIGEFDFGRAVNLIFNPATIIKDLIAL